MSIFLGKRAFYLTSTLAKQQQAAQAGNEILRILGANETYIKTTLGQTPRGYIFVEDTHTSRSDSKPHYTVDAYGSDEQGNDKPIGCIHVYNDNTIMPYAEPRAKAREAYQSLVG